MNEIFEENQKQFELGRYEYTTNNGVKVLFQRLTHDTKWYVVAMGQIINRGMYRQDLEEWCEIALSDDKKIKPVKKDKDQPSTNVISPTSFSAGQKIWFASEKKPYTVRCCDNRFVICTKPFNPKKTVLYTIIDLNQNIRGTESLLFSMGFESDECCYEALERLQKGRSEVSRRNRIKLDITHWENS